MPHGLIVSREYILATVAALLIVLAVGSYLLSVSAEQARAPKVAGLEIIEPHVVRGTSGILVELKIQSHATERVCINFIDLVDLVTRARVTIGDGDPSEASGLPFCLGPHATVVLGGFQASVDPSSFTPGRRVMVVLHYSVNTPDTVYKAGNPHTVIHFATVVEGE